MDEFNGAIIGLSRPYEKKAYILEDRVLVSIKMNEDIYMISENKEEDSVCELFYFKEKDHYCIQVKEKNTVYLESGLPLGEDKQYHLLPGTKLYIYKKENTFQLA